MTSRLFFPVTAHRLLRWGLALAPAALALGALLLSAPALAAPVTLPCYATPNNGTTTFGSNDATAVQDAIDAASPGDTVKIAGTCVGVQPRAYAPLGVAGVYSQTGYISKTLTVMGGFTTTDWLTSDPVANPTVLDGNASGQVLVIDAPGLAVEVVNLNVTNGYAGPDPDEGAGITIYTATVTVSNTQVYSNYAEGEGGGLSTINGVVAIVDSAFYNNYAVCSGGAIENFDSHMTIANSYIYTNTAGCAGGGVSNVSAEASTRLTITNGSRIEDNFADDGGGVYNEAALVIDGSSVAGNVAGLAGGISNYGGFTVVVPEVTLRNGASVAGNYAVLAGGGIYNEDGNVTIDDSQVVSNTTCCLGGGGIYVLATVAATLTVQNGSSINYNSTEGAGGGIYNEDGWVEVNASEVAWNESVIGGGIYQDSCSCIESRILITNGAVIKHNHAVDDGNGGPGEGGGAFNDYGHLIVANSVVYSNTADQDGGGISSQDYLTITNSYIGANVSVYNDGGGLDPDGPTWIYGSTIADNQAGEDGGGLDIDWDTYIENSLIIRNSAGVSPSLEPADGGGIHFYDGVLTITGTQILSNSAPVAGGGLYADWEITMTNSLVQGNRADLGGGVYVDWYATAALDGVQVLSNTAVITGGGVFLDTGLLTVTHSTIAENAAAGEGGGFYSTGANTLAITATRILSNTAANGGALFQADGTTTVNESCIVANRDTAVNYAGGTSLLDATANWWGHATGPSGAGGGLGDSVSSDVDFGGFLGAAILGCPAITYPDLAIVKATAPYVLRGGAVTYTLAFSNSGDGPAANVVISDSIPLSITVTGVTSSTTGGTIVATGAAPDLAWTLAELPAGAQGVITVTGVLTSAAPAGAVITNTATITASGEVTPGVHSSAAAFTVVRFNVFPAQPGVAPGGLVTISATVRPALAGLTVNFAMLSGFDGLGSYSAATDANGVAAVQYTAGVSAEVVQIEGALAVAPDVRDRGILYVAKATVAGAIATATGDPFTAGNLAPNHILITKTGAGAPPLGWAEFAGNPCPAAAPGSRIVAPYVDVMVDDDDDVNEVVVTLRYTDTAQAAQHKLYWCNLGVWQQVTGTVHIDTGNATLVFTITAETTPALFQLAGTPFVGVGYVPTAATVGDFLAVEQDARVSLTWQTLNELGLTGFRLYRGLDAAGPGEPLTGEQPVPAQGAGGLQGFTYSYDDFTPRPPETAVYYWLEELHGDGVYRHGPLRVGGAGSLRVFLPAISQGGAAVADSPPPVGEGEPVADEPARVEDDVVEVMPAATPTPDAPAPALEPEPTVTPEAAALEAVATGETLEAMEVMAPAFYLPLITR